MTAPILITGGSQRLGLAIAQSLISEGLHGSDSFSSEQKGATKKTDIAVIVTYRTNKPAIEALIRQGVVAIQADFASNEGIASFVATLKTHTKQLRGIIHNASDWEKETPEADFAQLFAKMMQVHASAPYQINLACKDMLIVGADIIHMTDYVQDKGSHKHIAYAASKAALHNLTLSFAGMLAPTVKVNSIAPSLLMFNEHDSESYKQKALSKSLLEICPGADEAVKAVKFILSSTYMTGQVMHLNGGRNLK